MKYTAYYYDTSKVQCHGLDTNDLYVNGKWVSMISCCRSADTLSELEPQSETEILILVVPAGATIEIVNHNPCPEEPFE